MMPQAHVTSIEALDLFRAQLIVYIEKALGAVNDVTDDVVRTRAWLQSDQPLFWQAQVRRRTKDLEMAQQELATAQLGNLGEAATARLMAVTKAKRALNEAEEKLACVKKWARHYENEVATLVKQVDKLGGFVTTDLRHAVAHLTQVIDTLDAYSGRGGFSSEPAAAPLEQPSVSADAASGGGKAGSP
ncbi:MAG TPA: hypothetical protein VI454_12390 [Verrucomicrobiae bacterium]|jgi:DNA repair ATPase RecN